MQKTRIEEVYKALRTVEEESSRRHGKGDGTAERLGNEIGIGGNNVRNNLRKLKAQGRAHILCWTDYYIHAPVWVKGAGEDAPKPPPLTKEEYLQRHLDLQRERRQKAREEAGGRTKKERAASLEQHIEQARIKPQSWFSALG